MTANPEVIEEGTTVALGADQLEEAALDLLNEVLDDLDILPGGELTPLQQSAIGSRVWEYLTRLGFGGRSPLWEDQLLLNGQREKEISSL